MVGKQFVLACLLLTTLALSVLGTKDDLKKSIEKCSKEHTLTDEELENFKHHENLETSESKCFLKCIAEDQLNFFADGEYNHEKMVEHVKESHDDYGEHMATILDACKDFIKSDEPCEAAFELYNCWIKEDEESIFEKEGDVQ